MTSLWSPRILSAVALVLVLYVGAYVWFRQTSTEIWERDKQAYVIFPAGNGGGALYYLWRPLSYVDGSLTGMRFHIGPHR
jgi:hypothetical protein